MDDIRKEYINIDINKDKRYIIRGLYQYDHGLK